MARLPTERELRETEVLALPIEEWSAKVRTGPPVETELDAELDVWSGVIPVSLVQGEPVRLLDGTVDPWPDAET